MALADPDANGIWTEYLHRDHQGSIVAITSEAGELLARFRYDAWGKRSVAVNLNAATDPFTTLTAFTTHGYTGHEHLQHVGLIHMNGRVYDPAIGRFLSADPFMQFPDSTQGWNRYTYVGNNPLSYMDPSGFFLGKLGNFIKENIGTIINVGFALAGMPFIGGLLSSATTTVMNGGNFGQFIGGFLVGSATGPSVAAWPVLSSGLWGSLLRDLDQQLRSRPCAEQ